MAAMRLLFCAAACWLGVALSSQACPAAHIAQPVPEGRPLAIANASSEEVLSLAFGKGRSVHYIRLDMGPGGSDEMEHPGNVTDIQVDTGLALWDFHGLSLEGATALSVHDGPSLELTMPKGGRRTVAGVARPLLPGPDAGPVCALDRFRPGMRMDEVCALLPADLPRDDNGALLTSLGFAGLTWAARVEAASDGKAPRLEHLELRRPLDPAALKALFQALYAQGYAPWQAELPGMDINFIQMPFLDQERQKQMLAQVLEHFLSIGKGEAGIMLAPAAMLPRLADADAPSGEMQLFTLTLRPEVRRLLVDVTAYRETDAPN